jgi:hypothetical protein
VVEVDPEVGGEYEGETAALLLDGLALVGGEVGADEAVGSATHTLTHEPENEATPEPAEADPDAA